MGDSACGQLKRVVRSSAQMMNEQIQIDFVPGATGYDVEELSLIPSDLAMEVCWGGLCTWRSI